MKPDFKEDIYLVLIRDQNLHKNYKKKIYLGDWAIEKNRDLSNCLNYELRDIDEIYKDIEGIKKNIFPKVAFELNKYHEKNNSIDYWELILGIWFSDYISIVYERFNSINFALLKYKKITTTLLDEKSFLVPDDGIDFIKLLRDDYYQLQLMTRIFDYKNIYFNKEQLTITKKNLFGEQKKNGVIKTKLVNIYNKFLCYISVKINIGIHGYTFFNKNFQFYLLLKTGFKFYPYIRGYKIKKLKKIDNKFRSLQDENSSGLKDIEVCILSMIWKDIPRAYVEDYDQINDLANGYPKCVKVILSSTGWYFDEVFKFWAASAKNSGVLLAGIPHGGNFGSSKILPREDHELSVVNRYYTWGWKINGEKSSLTIPKPAPRLMSRLESSYKSKKFQILWATTDIQRYSVFPDSIFGKKNNYLDWQEKFSSKLNQTVRKNLVLRPHREIDDFDIALNIKKYIPEITIENFDTFDNSLKKCRLYICDHLSTTFTESLSVNKPTILFWNPIYNPLRGEALKFYELLMQAGILFHDPISAANAVNDVSNNIEEWWMEGKRQDLVREFCRNHAYTSTDYRVQWSREVKMLLNGKL